MCCIIYHCLSLSSPLSCVWGSHFESLVSIGLHPMCLPNPLVSLGTTLPLFPFYFGISSSLSCVWGSLWVTGVHWITPHVSAKSPGESKYYPSSFPFFLWFWFICIPSLLVSKLIDLVFYYSYWALTMFFFFTMCTFSFVHYPCLNGVCVEYFICLLLLCYCYLLRIQVVEWRGNPMSICIIFNYLLVW